jgi:hypothetical protein
MPHAVRHDVYTCIVASSGRPGGETHRHETKKRLIVSRPKGDLIATSGRWLEAIAYDDLSSLNFAAVARLKW